ncbi:MAG: hypothetical protein IJB82_02240 [Bacilli bacterium]|nr:hypothetical protein [Bacilli bacterium]
MNEVPNIISTKDLMYIEDMLNWNFVLIKKVKTLKSMVKDREIKRFMETVISEHKSSYEKLLSLIK